MMVSNRNLLFQRLIFRFHVNLQGCRKNKIKTPRSAVPLRHEDNLPFASSTSLAAPSPRFFFSKNKTSRSETRWCRDRAILYAFRIHFNLSFQFVISICHFICHFNLSFQFVNSFVISICHFMSFVSSFQFNSCPFSLIQFNSIPFMYHFISIHSVMPNAYSFPRTN